MHLSPLFLAVVLAGGSLGTLARYGLGLALPTGAGEWPTGTFTCNLLGAFLLGALLEELARRGPDAGTRRLVRLAAGTGFIGAFTTYSTLAVDTDLLVRGSHPALGAGYAVATVLAGLLMSAAGIRSASGRHRRRVQRPAVLPLDPDPAELDSPGRSA